MRQTGKIVINKLEKIKTPTNRTGGQVPITKCQVVEFLLISLNRLLMGFVTLYVCWMCLRLSIEEIPFHAVFCTIGFVCLMSEGLMAYYRANARTKLCDRSQKTKTHWILQLCGSVLGLIGVAIKIWIEDTHFHSIHGIVGLIASILLLFSLLSGLSALYAHEMKKVVQPMLTKTLHSVWGLLTYTAMMLSMFTAFDTNIFIEYSLDAATYNDFKWLIQISIAAIWLLTIYGPIWCLVYTKLWRSSSCC
ncbi:uncharacterized protein LOC133338576 [Musca vetustissima]|uniref:uncharacterized protein LOC133338576 n=1 Tax=Musca vetustissima TaxID=27455 RepID=UPI002AB7A463|nr:uncharacterized protein LOC133338576 [Musca vetustissima]